MDYAFPTQAAAIRRAKAALRQAFDCCAIEGTGLSHQTFRQMPSCMSAFAHRTLVLLIAARQMTIRRA